MEIEKKKKMMKDNNIDFEGFVEDFEEWEADCELYDEEDWPGLLELRKLRVERDPDDLHAQGRYAEALILNKKYDEAIEFLTPIYKNDPDFVDAVHLILDALFESGRTEDDFEWIKKPKITRMDKSVLDFCAGFLKGKRGGKEIFEIYVELKIKEEYLAFGEEDLFEALSGDERFLVTGDRECIYEMIVKLSTGVSGK